MHHALQQNILLAQQNFFVTYRPPEVLITTVNVLYTTPHPSVGAHASAILYSKRVKCSMQ